MRSRPCAFPSVAQDRVTADVGERQGLSDLEQTTYLVAARRGASGIIWGAGPLIRMDTAADESLGAAAWGAGPSIVLVQHADRLVSGLTASQIWGQRGTDVTTLQGFSTWIGNRHSVTFRLEARHEGRTGSTTMPLSVDVSRLIESGGIFVSVKAGARYYIDVPENLGPWGLRLELTCTYGKER